MALHGLAIEITLQQNRSRRAVHFAFAILAPDISLNHIFASVLPFIALQIAGLLVVLFLPDVALFLPRLLHP